MRAKRRFIAQGPVPLPLPALDGLLPGELQDYKRFPAGATGPGPPGSRPHGRRRIHRMPQNARPARAPTCEAAAILTRPPRRLSTLRSLTRTLLLVAALGGVAALPAAAQNGGSGSGPGSTTPAPPPPTPRLVVDRPTKHVFIREGNSGRQLL